MVTSFACEMVVATMVAISLTKFLNQKKDGMKETVRHEAVIVFASEIQDNKANAIPDVLIKIVYSLESDETCRFTWNSCEIWKLSLQWNINFPPKLSTKARTIRRKPDIQLWNQ